MQTQRKCGSDVECSEFIAQNVKTQLTQYGTLRPHCLDILHISLRTFIRLLRP